MGPEIQVIRTIADSDTANTHRIAIRQRPNVPEIQRIQIDFTPLSDIFSVRVGNTSEFSLTLKYFNRFDRFGTDWTEQSLLTSSYVKDITKTHLSISMSASELETEIASRFTSYELGGDADYSPVIDVHVLDKIEEDNGVVQYRILVEQDFTGSTTHYSAGPLDLDISSSEQGAELEVEVLQIGSYCEVQRVWIPDNGAGQSWYLIRDGHRTADMSMTVSANDLKSELELLQGVLSVSVSRELRAPEISGESSKYLWTITFTSVLSSYDGTLQMFTNLGIGEDETIIEQEMSAVPIQRGIERAVRSNVVGARGSFRVLGLGATAKSESISLRDTNSNEMKRLFQAMLENQGDDVRIDVTTTLGAFESRYWDITFTHHTGPIELLNVTDVFVLPQGYNSEGTTITVSRIQSVDTSCCASVPNGFHLSYTNDDAIQIQSDVLYLDSTAQEFGQVVSAMFDNDQDIMVTRKDLINQGVEWTFDTNKPSSIEVQSISAPSSSTSLVSEIVQSLTRSEIQRVEIKALDSNSRVQPGGGFVLRLGNEQTDVIPHNASAEKLAEVLRRNLSWNIGDDVDVSRDELENSDGGSIWFITFSSRVGDVPSLSGETIDITASPHEMTHILVSEIRQGTGERISGSFVLCHESQCTSEIGTNATSADMKAQLEVLPSMGHVNVSREDVKGQNGEYKWYVTFVDSMGDVSEMMWSHNAEFYDGSSMLSGTNARVLVTETHRGSYLGGQFNLVYAGHRSQSVPFDASAQEFRDVLINDMPTLENRDEIMVTRSDTREMWGGFVWQITFPGSLGNVESIQVDTSNLVGTNVFASVEEMQSGVDTLGGNLTVSFHGQRTPRFSVHSSASEFRDRLEALSTIGKHGVEVSRHVYSSTEISWDVTFVSRGSVSLLSEQSLLHVDDIWISGSHSETTVSRIQSSCCDVSISNNGVDFATLQTKIFAFEGDVRTEKIEPSSGTVDGGTIVRIVGDTPFVITATTFCMFHRFGLSTKEVEASVDQDGAVVCRTPSVDLAGEYHVDVKQFSSSANSAYATIASAIFTYHDIVFISKLLPEFGPIRGDTNIHIVGENFVNSSTLSCRFSFLDTTSNQIVNLDVKAKQFVSEQEIVCVAPAFRSYRPSVYDESSNVYLTASQEVETTRLRVSNNGVDFSASSHAFRYLPGVVVSSVTPSKSVIHGGTLVTISGQNFARSNEIKCGFGSSDIVSAMWISSETVICKAPPREFRRSTKLLQVRSEVPSFEVQKISVLSSERSEGSFQVSYKDMIGQVEVLHNSSAEDLQLMLLQLASLGDYGVQVSRDTLDLVGNYFWYVTFMEDDPALLSVESTNLTANASVIVERISSGGSSSIVEEVQHVILDTPHPKTYRIDVDTTDPLISEMQRFEIETDGLMSGMFAIVNSDGNVVSKPLVASTCTEQDFYNALQDMYFSAKIDSLVKSVSADSDDCLISCSRSWTATFREGDGDMPQLYLLDISVVSSGPGNVVTMTSSTVQDGTSAMSGYLQLGLGNETVRFHVRSDAHTVFSKFTEMFPDVGLLEVQVNRSDASHQSWSLSFSRQALGSAELHLDSTEVWGHNVIAQLLMTTAGDVLYNKTFSLCTPDDVCTTSIPYNASAQTVSDALSLLCESVHVTKDNDFTYVVRFPKWRGNMSELLVSDLFDSVVSVRHLSLFFFLDFFLSCFEFVSAH